jgi:hypothetical protein
VCTVTVTVAATGAAIATGRDGGCGPLGMRGTESVGRSSHKL